MSEAHPTYYHPDTSKAVPSVTTIIGAAWPQEHLERWKIGNIAKRCVENAESLAERFDKIAKRDAAFGELSVATLQEKFMGWKEDTTAANRGTRIHAGLEALLSGTKKKVVRKEMDKREFEIVLKAVDALERMKMEPEHIEARVIKETPLYAGTLDLIVNYKRVLRGQKRRYRAVVDLKTGRRIHRSYAPQIAAYAFADAILNPDKDSKTATLCNMPRITTGMVLHVTASGGDFYKVDLQSGWEDFLACHRIYTAANKGGSLHKYGD